MHWVDRGPEPHRLEDVRTKYTTGWVSHYRGDGEEMPSDSLWARFRDELSSRFHGICGYCEEEVDQSQASVDHFRPKSKFPELVYEWSNWVFACRDCNNEKEDKWPLNGYVDPCACLMSERPENYFDFDTYTGEILPKLGLSPERRSKAWVMIKDIGLNKDFHIRRRNEQIKAIRSRLSELADTRPPNALAGIECMAGRGSELSSVARKVLGEYGMIP